jgi:hypothetical protein
MGSPLSFPILCLVNAAICSLSYKRDWEFSDVPLSEQPLLVNGDDCVMNFNSRQKEAWERISAHAGLSPSVGKCYYSARFLQINSENFILEDGKFVSIPYINFSLCNPVKAKGGEPRHWSDLGATARQFVKGHDDSVKPRLMQIFIRRQSIRYNKQIPSGMSWWLPECLGGLGLPYHPVDGSSVPSHLSRQQLRLATYLRGRIEAGEPPMRRFQSTWIPSWAKRGMRWASSWERPVLADDDCEFFNEKGEEISKIVYEETRNGLKTKLVGDFGPWMWESLRDASSDELHMEPAEDLCAHKGFWKVWKTAQESCFYERDAEELLRYVPPVFALPGGLSHFFSRALHSVPKNILSAVTALRLLPGPRKI